MPSKIGIRIKQYLPGLILCAAIVATSTLLEMAEVALFGHAWLESLVLAIMLGCAIGTFMPLPQHYALGVQFSAKVLLEIAVILLGASVSATALMENGITLVAGIACVVASAIFLSYIIGRYAGLPCKMAMLIACGNSICGNSAIAAVAPIIQANSEDVASSIAFTAILGVVVVLALPFISTLLSLSNIQYGVFTGLTVYAVPQVLAATASVSSVSLHIGTLVKLVRVLMLGPVILMLSFFSKQEEQGTHRMSTAHLLPWFIIGFLTLLGLRSFDLIPHAMLPTIQTTANLFTVMSMAALGLGVNVKVILQAGQRVSMTVILSLLSLAAISLALIKLLHIP